MNRYQKNAAWVFRVVGILFFLYLIFRSFILVFAGQFLNPDIWAMLIQQLVMLSPQLIGSFLLILFAIPLGKLAAKGIDD